MSVLVTGGAGYIGSHMLLGLVDRGEAAVALDNLSTGFALAIPAGVQLYAGDVGDGALLQRIFAEHQIESVLHFAASTVVPESVAQPVAYYRNNTVNAARLIDAAAKAGVANFIFSSTAAVYASSPERPVREDDVIAPASPYGASKLMTETALMDIAAASGMRAAVLRYFNVAGADPQMRAGQSTRAATHLIKVCARAAAGVGGGVDVYGQDYPTPDGTGVRDYIHVSDLIDAHLLALDALRTGRSALLYNCGYGRGFSVLDVINATKRASGADFEVRFQPRRAGDAGAVVANADRIRTELNWRPRFDDLDTIVSHALAWERKLIDGAA